MELHNLSYKKTLNSLLITCHKMHYVSLSYIAPKSVFHFFHLIFHNI